MWEDQRGFIVLDGDNYLAPNGELFPAARPKSEIPWLTWIPDLPPSEATLRQRAKVARDAAVAAIKVTTAAGNTFDGDEVSQGRMARAIAGLSTGRAPSVTWVRADNSVIQATSDELTEALFLAGQAQAALWVLPS